MRSCKLACREMMKWNIIWRMKHMMTKKMASLIGMDIVSIVDPISFICVCACVCVCLYFKYYSLNFGNIIKPTHVNILTHHPIPIDVATAEGKCETKCQLILHYLSIPIYTQSIHLFYGLRSNHINVNKWILKEQKTTTLDGIKFIPFSINTHAHQTPLLTFSFYRSIFLRRNLRTYVEKHFCCWCSRV